MFKVLNAHKLMEAVEKHVKTFENTVIDQKADVTSDLLTFMLQRTPVSSGKTVTSYVVSNSGAVSGTSSIKQHTPYQKGSGSFPVGRKQEQYANWTKAESTLKSTDFDLAKSVWITNGSILWGDMDSGVLPDRIPSGGISQPALSAIRAKYKGVK